MKDHEHQDEPVNGDDEAKKSKQGSGKRLNDRQRVDIIQMAEHNSASKRQLADQFGVSEAAIRKLLRKKDVFLRRYYDTPENLRDQRVRGKQSRHAVDAANSSNGCNGSGSSSHSDVVTPTKSARDIVHSKRLYPFDEVWKQGMHALLIKVTPFFKRFIQSSRPFRTAAYAVDTTVATSATFDHAAKKTHDEDGAEIDWIGFSRALCDIRRGLHRYPETGYQEIRTQAFIRQFCEQALQIPGKNIRDMASTGLIVDVCHENATFSPSDRREVPVLAFRADMDALPIEELNDHLSYCSSRKGGCTARPKRKKRKGPAVHLSLLQKSHEREVEASPTKAHAIVTPASCDVSPHVGTEALAAVGAPPGPSTGGDDDDEGEISTAAAHMCGHDGHMAMVLGLCAMVVRTAHRLPQNTFVRFLFQPAEEGPGGAIKMIEDGALLDVNEVYGCHNAPFPLHSIHVRPGPVMAHEVEFSIDIDGVGGHGSAPHQCVDPILTGAAVVQALQSVVSRSLAPTATAVVSVTQFRGGDTNNVIPSQVFLGGTIRDFDLQVAATIKDRVVKVVHSTCAAYGATANVRFLDGYAPVVNPEVETRQVQQIAMELGLVVSEEGLPLMAAEDFSYYLQERKGCFFFLGTKEDGDSEKLRALHSNYFDFNDKAIPLGIRLFLGILQSRLQCEFYSLEEMQAFQVAMERFLLNVTVA